MRIKEIIFGVTGGWFVLSLGAIAYLASNPATLESLTSHGLARASVNESISVAQPPDRPPTLNAAEAAKDPELAALLYRYFPAPLSEHLEEVFIRDYFEDRKGGFLLDVGASHYKIRSNTYYMDVALGWHGIAVDAIPELGPNYAAYRPRTKFFPLFVSDKSDQDIDFFVTTGNSRLSTADAKTAQTAGSHEKRKLKTATLNALLESQGVKKVDLLNMDIELWEPHALAGFDIDKYKPDLVVIEMHPPVKQAIEDYFAKHGYVVIEKYTRWDGSNAYFIPKADLQQFLARKDSEKPAAAQAPDEATVAKTGTAAPHE